MTGVVYERIERPPKDLVDGFKGVPTGILSDSMHRLNAMRADIKPLVDNIWICGPAVTVKTMVGDNIMVHKAIEVAERGDIIVVDGRGFKDTSLWGNIMSLACRKKGIAGVVIDGAVRDAREIRESRFPLFCGGVVPAGPHKEWGGSINVHIQCGGVGVSPGDIIVGDDDGVVVVPRADAGSVLEASRKRMALEDEWVRAVESGESTLKAIGLDKKFEKLDVEVKK